MGFERSMDLTAEKKNDGGLTKYGFGFDKEIKGFGAEKSWGLNEVWICQRRKKKKKKKKKPFSPYSESLTRFTIIGNVMANFCRRCQACVDACGTAFGFFLE